MGESTAVTDAKLQALLNKMARLGAPLESIEQVERRIEEEKKNNKDCIVWPENRLAVTAFLACATQWDRAAMDGTFLALRWEAVNTVMARHPEVKALPEPEFDEVFWQITAMERYALSEFAAIKEERKARE
ncbi:hypothetical protein EXT46_05290 [Pseudoalteromonas sp. CO325X]|uniref:DUF1799 domain-containing protein n=1 Tax=Pseudoalteromonas sp. CO325X TaxID=1777262 RepID=UPI001023BB30|nr:DUF1799 domain-containing protein [Pseudoalteromonas sp. CO325X]RZF83708.1 hypothetical protein EXT46_05290 [Pseudoalteromonas sp. CO325X]